MTADDRDRRPILIVIECLSAGAIDAENTVTAQYASLYIASGVAADEVFTVAHLQKHGAASVRLADGLKMSDAERLADALAHTLREHGVLVEVAGIYDD